MSLILLLLLLTTLKLADKFRVNKNLRSEGPRALDLTSRASKIPLALSADLAQMVKNGVMTAQQACDMMRAGSPSASDAAPPGVIPRIAMHGAC